MGTWVHGYDICDWVRDLIYDNLKSSMGLKYVSVGSLADHVMNTALSNDVPFVMVDIVEPSPQDALHLGGAIETMYNVRVVYVWQFSTGEEAAKEKMEAIETIANYLQDSQGLLCGTGTGALSLTGGLVMNARLNGMEYVAAESELLAEARMNLQASACNLLVHVDGSGS